MDRSNSFKYIAVSFSVFTSKLIPLIIGVFLVSKLSVNDYNSWTYLLYLTFLFSAVLNTKINTDFARNFKTIENKVIPFYFHKRDVVYISMFILLVGFSFFSHTIFIGILFSIIAFGLPVYNYLLQYLRFTEQYLLLVLFGISRIVLFFPVFFFQNNILNYMVIFYAISIILPVVILLVRNETKVIVEKGGNDTLLLFLYGVLLSLGNNIEKYTLKWVGYDEILYANLNYMIFLISFVTILNEVIKKIVVPQMYNDFNSLKKLSRNTKKLRKTTLGFLIPVSLGVPYLFQFF